MDSARPSPQRIFVSHSDPDSGSALRRHITLASMQASLQRVVSEVFAYAQFDDLVLDACEAGCITISARFRSPALRCEALARGRKGRAEAAALLEDAVTHVLLEWYGGAWIEDIRVERSGSKVACSFIAHSSTHDDG